MNNTSVLVTDSMEKPAATYNAAPSAGKRIAILVPNVCNPDYRVIKQAQSLAAEGYDVRIFAVRRGKLPSYEVHNKVVYIRQPWDFLRDITRYFFGMLTKADEMREERSKNLKMYDDLIKKSREED